MAENKTFRIDLDHPGAVQALRAYAKAEPDVEAKLKLDELIADTIYNREKIARRAKVQAILKLVGPKAARHEPHDAEEDTGAEDDLRVDSPIPPA